MATTAIKINEGDRFGRWTVIKRTEGSGGKGKAIYYDCRCDCGTLKSVCGKSLRNGASQSCGCLARERTALVKKKDLVGEKFGRLTVLKDTGRRENNKIIWLCVCECGQKVEVRSTYLTSGDTKSCGCLHKDWMHTTFSKNIAGLKSGKLTALEPTEKRSQGCVVWKCQCECGNFIETPVSYFLSQEIRSCGCEVRSKGEVKIIDLLTKFNIPFECQKTFQDCRFIDTNNLARFDFFVDNKYLIEYDGEQHFMYRNSGWNTKENYEKTKLHDAYKNEWCKQHNIPLIRIPYTHLELLSIKDLQLETSQYII